MSKKLATKQAFQDFCFRMNTDKHRHSTQAIKYQIQCSWILKIKLPKTNPDYRVLSQWENPQFNLYKTIIRPKKARENRAWCMIFFFFNSMEHIISTLDLNGRENGEFYRNTFKNKMGSGIMVYVKTLSFIIYIHRKVFCFCFSVFQCLTIYSSYIDK